MIRQAKFTDISTLCDMCESFWDHSTQAVPFHRESALSMLISSYEKGCILVGEINKEIKGFIVLTIGPVLVNHNILQATELAWWVEPSHRKTTIGIKLLNEAEKLATSFGCKFLNVALMFSSMPEEVQSMYERKGYRQSESLFSKELT